MNYRRILVGTLFFPCLAWAQSPQAEKTDSVSEDLSLVGVIDAASLSQSADDDGNTSQDVNTTVLTSHDTYLNKVGFQLSPMRFRLRGYESWNEERYINGIPFNDQVRGTFNYSSIGAMNDFTRAGDQTNYTDPGNYTFGALGGTQNIFMRAGNYARGGKAILSFTNRNYYWRGMLSYHTGLSRRGWAFSALVGGRYASEGVVDGTFYNNFAYAFLLEKQWQGGKHSLSLATFGSPVRRGQGGSGALRETYAIVGDNQYNANWGYFNGKKRNARVVESYDPTGILSYEWKITPSTVLNLGAAVHYSQYSQSALNWYRGADPRPDYYRYLPSYWESLGNTDVADIYRAEWASGNTEFTQINWDALVAANRRSVMTGDGNAIYLVEKRHNNLFETTFNAALNTQLNRRNKLTAGLVGRISNSHQYKTVDDLLGAAYLLDIDKYADQDYPGDVTQAQKDLNNPNRKAYEGDTFDYDYNLHVRSLRGFVVNQFSSAHWDAYAGLQLTHTNFYREGNMRNGHYADISYGKGAEHNFTNLMAKAGLTYKIDGRNLIRLNGQYGSVAPMVNDAYITPHYADLTPATLESGRVFSADLSYIFSTQKLSGRITAFHTRFLDQLERTVYYDNDAATFINYVMTGVDRTHQGIELGLTYKLDSHWSFDFAGTVAEYFYSNNPTGYVYADNGSTEIGIPTSEKVYMKNVYVGGVPQIAGTLGVRYFVNYWFLGANLNGFARNYVDATPSRRMQSRYASIDPTNEAQVALYRQMLKQERFGSGYTIDLSVGKIIYLGRKNSVNFNLAFNNILNRKNIVTGGYEQGRIDLTYPQRYGNKIFYMQGFNVFLNASYKF